MARCPKCDGCTSMWETIYKPSYCKDPECPEGIENPDKRGWEEKLNDYKETGVRSKLKT